MTDPKDPPLDLKDLRRQAEVKQCAEAIPPENLSPAEAARLIHELRVRQIELERQNEELRRSQARLEVSRSRYADLYDFAPGAYLTLDEQGRIVEANLTASTLLGVERRKLLKRRFARFLVDEDRQGFRRLLKNGRNQRRGRGEFRLRDGNGDVRFLLLDILFLTDAEGRKQRRLALTDITELQRAQEELRLHKENLEKEFNERTAKLTAVNEQLQEANAKLEALFQAAPLAIGVFDNQGRIVNVNPASERIFGWSREEVVSRLPLSIPQGAPEESLAIVHRVLQGESFVGLETRQQRQDGTFIDVSFSAAPLYDAQGNVQGFIGLAEDVTERKKLEEAARTQAMVLENMAEGVTVTDSRGYILYTNPAFDAMFGYEPGELLGRHSSLLNHYPPEENSRLVGNILKSVNAAGVWAGELRNCKKNGSPFLTFARVSTVKTGGKKLYISVQEDISKRKRAEETLKRQAELLDLAHDAILVRDARGRITYWNQGAEKHYGWTRGEALGQVSHKLLKTVFPQPLLEIERHLIKEGFWEGELIHTNRQGQRLVMSSRWSVKRDEGGKVVAILEMGQDITAQKQIEQEVHRMASFPLRNPNPVLEVDEEGQVVYANPAARNIAEKLNLAEGVKAFLPPGLEKLFAAARQGGPREYFYDRELNGAVFAVAMNLPHDLPTARLYAMDITKRKRAEVALRESEEKFRLAFENANVGMALVGLNGKYLRVNEALSRMLGYSREELEKMGIRDLTYADDLPLSREFCQQALSGETDSIYLEKRKVHKNGDIVWVNLASSLVRDAQGQPLYFISQLQDITARKRAEQSLVRAKEEWERTFDAVPDFIALLDKEHRITRMNKAMTELLGGNPEEAMGLPCYKTVHGLDGAPHFCPHSQVMATGQEYSAEVREFGRTFIVSVSPIFAPNGHLIGGVHVARDITARKQAEEALQESEERYRSLFENNHAVMLLIDPDTAAIVDANPAACRYYGYSREELLARTITDLNTLSPEQVLVEMQQAKAEKRKHFEFRHRLASGEVRDVEVFSGPIRIKGRELLYSIVHDITARKEAEDALRESEARFRSLFEHMTEGVALHEIITDDQGSALDYRILAINPAFTVHTGISPEQVQGRLASEAYGTGEAPYLEIYARVAHTGQPEVFETFFPPLERYFTISATSPKPGHFVTVFEDITARKRMEAALRESREDLNRAQAVAQTGSWRMNVQKNELTWSEENHRIFGIPPGTSMTYETFLGTVHPEDRDYVDRKWKAALAGEPYDIEHRIVVDGAVKWVRERAGLEFDQEGRLLGGFGTTQDITQRKEMEEALRRARDELEVRVLERTAALRLANEQLLWEIEERQQVEDRLRESEARFAAFMEHLPGLAVMRDVEGRYLFANRAWEKMMGLEPGAWMKKTLAEVWSPSQAAALEKVDFQVISSGEPVEQVEIVELADGPHHFLTHRFPIRDKNGLPFMVGSIAIDVTDRRRAEEALAEHAALVRDLYNNAPCGYHSLDPDGLIIRINDTELAWLGYTREEVVGRWKFSDLLTPESQKVFQENFPGFKARGFVKDLEYEMVRRDGTILPVSLSATAVMDEAGDYVMSRSTIFDITDRKRAERALAEERQRLFALMEQIPAYVVLLAPDYTVPYANREFIRRFGEAEEGQKCYEFLFGRKEPCPDCQTFEVLQENQPLEWEWLGPDGRTYAVYDYPFTDADGSNLILEMGIDITDRKQAEEALKQKEAMLRQILETLPVGVWVTDREGRIVQANPAAQRIWGGARYVGIEEYGEYQGWWADTGKKIDPEEWALARAVQKGETSLGEVINIQCFDGARKTIINSAVPLFGDNHDILGAIVVNQDITELVRAEEVMREQARQMEAFFAHSLNPFVFLDPQFNFLRVNEAYARACQRPVQDFIGHNHFEFYPNAGNQAIFAEVVRTKIPYQVQARPFEFPDHPEWGVTYWDWSLVPILDQTGEVDFLVFSLRDVTRRVLSEQARNRLIEILEATPDFVGIADYYGNLQYLNRAGRAMVGLGEHEDISRLRVLDLHPQKIGEVILETGSPTAIREGAWQAELALLHRDGREIPVSQVILAHKDPSGRVEFFSTVARDISEMKQAQESILRQTAVLNGINRIFREALASETEEDLGRVCLTVAEELTGSRFGFIDKLDEQGQFDVLAFSDPGWELCALAPEKDPVHLQNIKSAGLLALPIREGKSLIANAPGSHPEAAGIPAGHPPLTAYLGVPLRFGGQTLGLMGLGNKEGGYTPADQEAVESLAPAIVEALMHRRAEEALKKSESKLRYLADQLLTAQENERKRLAAELHDELGHALLALKLALSSIAKQLLPEQENIKEEIQEQLSYINEVIAEVRRLYHDLSPGDVEDLGLTRALEALVGHFAALLENIIWEVDLPNLDRLFSLPVQTIIYRIVQEALTNIGKHANPKKVTVSARQEGTWLHLTIQDDGQGFDVARILEDRSGNRGVGLVAMEERLNMVGGSFAIQSGEQAGTRLSFTIPILPEGDRP